MSKDKVFKEKIVLAQDPTTGYMTLSSMMSKDEIYDKLCIFSKSDVERPLPKHPCGNHCPFFKIIRQGDLNKVHLHCVDTVPEYEIEELVYENNS